MEDQQSCVFCNIVAGTASAHRIYEDDLSMAILDIHPLAQGHALVLSKRHVPWWHELNAFWQGKRRYVGEGLEGVNTHPPNTA